LPLFETQAADKKAGKPESAGWLVKYKGSPRPQQAKLSCPDIAAAQKHFASHPEVEYVEPNYTYRTSVIPSDTYYSNQWYLKKIKAQSAWDQKRGSPEVTVAIIDTGVDTDHPDLENNIWRNPDETPDNNQDDDNNGYVDDIRGWDFTTDTPDPSPDMSGEYTPEGLMHGTIVAGVIGASGNNATGISGVTWRVNLMPLKVLNDRGEGESLHVVRAIDYAIENGADIINLSFVGFGYSRSLEAAIDRAYDSGVLVVAAAGNEKGQGKGYFLEDTPMYPVCHDGDNGENKILGVAATDTLDQKAPFSSYGFKCIDLSAPGVSIFSTAIHEPGNDRFNSYYNGYWSGTSMAAPMVSGAAALVKAANPGLDNREIASYLMDTTDNINRLNPEYLGRLGTGRLNVLQAVKKSRRSLKNRGISILYSGQAGKDSQVTLADRNGLPDGRFYAYNQAFRGGTNLAGGDVDGDDKAEIITGAGPGGGPHVRVFDSAGSVKDQFFAYNAGFRGGVNVAVGDVDGDDKAEIITGAGPGGGPHVRVFDSAGSVKDQFFAYNAGFRGGVNVAVGSVDHNGSAMRAKIITAPAGKMTSLVKIFDRQGAELENFTAFDDSFRGGVNLAAGDIDKDGYDEIVTGAGPGGGPHVKIYRANGVLFDSFYAFKQNVSIGVNVGTYQTTNQDP